MSQTHPSRRAGLWRHIIATLGLVLLLSVPARTFAQSGPLTVPAGTPVRGAIATTAQDILVDGTVEGDVTSWSGNITITGHVDGDVVSYTGQIVLGPEAEVAGNVLALEGQISRAAGAQVGGRTLDGSHQSGALGSLLDLFTPGPAQASGQAALLDRLLLSLGLGVLVLAFCTLWAALWPRPTNRAALMLRSLPGRAALLGLLTTTVLGLTLLPLVALLTASILGLPLALLLLLVLHMVYIYGLAALIKVLGDPAPGDHTASAGPSRRLVGVAFGLAVLIGLVALVQPSAGLALFYLLASPGVGAVILCRGGQALPQLAR